MMAHHEENGTESLNWWWSNFGVSGHPVFRATSPLSRGTVKSKGGGKLCIHVCADGETIETVFRTVICVRQLSIYRAVSDLCDEKSSCQTGRLVVAEHSHPHFAPAVLLVTTPTPSTDDPAQEEDLLQRYQERVERLSQQNRVIKFSTDAGFLTTVDVGQYFMTKDIEEFSQFTEPVACREYTLPIDEKIIWPERLDSREHQKWTRIGSHNQLLARYIWSGN